MSADDLLTKVRGPGFTPGRRDVPRLLALLADVGEDDATRVVRALAQVPDAAAQAEAMWARATPPQRHRLIGLVGRARRDSALELLERALTDEDPRTRKAAARALGRTESASVRARAAAALSSALACEPRDEVKRAIVEAIGKVGGEAQLEAVKKLGGDALLERMRDEASRRIERGRVREEPSAIVEAQAEEPFELVLRCREGLEGILATEVASPRVLGPGRVRVRVRSLREATAARVWSSVALPLYEGPAIDDERVAETIAAAAPKLRVLTNGPVRYRLEWVGAGHRRGATRTIAQRTASHGLVNDPIASDWEIEVARIGRSTRVDAVPKSWDDRRFAYRVADVPAASHPTIAAAIARLGGVRDDDVVWDPFVGSGLELIERARLGPYAELIGSDIDERALAAARKNLTSARVQDARIVHGDARSFDPSSPSRGKRVTLVLSNPPMGRRIPARPELDAFLDDVLRNVARALRRDGVFVWMTPRARSTDATLDREGFAIESSTLVDMGGFTAALQRCRRR